MANDWMPASKVTDCWIATGEGTCYDGYFAKEHPDIQRVRVTSIMEYDDGTSGPYVYTSYSCSQCRTNLTEWGDTVELLDQPKPAPRFKGRTPINDRLKRRASINDRLYGRDVPCQLGPTGGFRK